MQTAIRRTNGTIDVDHYRTIAVKLRRETSVAMMCGAQPTLWAMAAGAALLVAFIVLGSHRTVAESVHHAAVAPHVQTR
jgi:hypothetical protein